MAEVVKVPVVGKVPKPWLYAGGAAAAGIAGYAWWTRGALVEDETTAVELPATEFEPPTVLDSGISVGGTGQQGEPIARTNVEWSTMAREQAAAFGASEALTNTALSKYLGKDRLSVAEAALISAIVAVLGQPPTGGPYSILPAAVEPPPAHVGLPALIITKSMPVLRNGAYEYVISWLPVSGAARYYFEHVGGSTGHVTATSTSTIRARPGQLDVWRFAAVSASNERGPVSTVTTQMPGGTTPSAPGGQSKPTAPTRVIAKAIGGGRASISWAGAHGGPGSFYEIRSRGIVGVWKRVDGTSYTSGPWRRGAKLAFEVRTRNRLGTSPGRVSNTIVIT